VEAYGLRAECRKWLIEAVARLLAAPRVQLFAGVGNGWPHNAPRYLCQSAAASEIAKLFRSRVWLM